MEKSTSPELLPGWSDITKLLVIRLDNIGDVIIAGPALRAIKATLPHVHLTFMVSPAGSQAAPLLPWVDSVLTARALWQDLGALSFEPLREWRLIHHLQQQRFDAAIIFTSFSQSPFPAGLACLLAGIALRAGSSKENDPGILTTSCGPYPDHIHQVDRNLSLLKSLGFSKLHNNLSIDIKGQEWDSAQQLLCGKGMNCDEPYILANPWASARARTYPESRFIAAASELAKRSGLPVVITGSLRDRPRSKDVTSFLGPWAVNTVGQTTVPELAALVKHATLALTNDTSVMHIADAVNTPQVILYSGTELESQWRPRRTKHILLRRPTHCSPCYAFDCPRSLECLDIPPQEVVEAAIRLLADRDRSAINP